MDGWLNGWCPSSLVRMSPCVFSGLVSVAWHEIAVTLTLRPTKVHLVKAMVFPVVMYGCESLTIKKAEH